MEKNFSKYKNTLKQVLNHFGIKTAGKIIRCFSPTHPDKNPSMEISENHFCCYSCGITGDVFDVIETLEGESNKLEQLKRVKQIVGDSWQDLPPKNDYKNFSPSSAAQKKIVEILKKNNDINGILNYLHSRHNPEDMARDITKYFLWWPGRKVAEKEIGWKLLFQAGIPAENPETKKSNWGPAGALLKIGEGFKLFYYEKLKSKKFGSKKCKTFPFPDLPKTGIIRIVEAEISALSMRFAGWPEAVAIGGVNGLTTDDIKKILHYDQIWIYFDGDDAGRKSRELLKNKIFNAGYTGEVKIVRLPEGKDPDDLIVDDQAYMIIEAEEKAEKKNEAPAPPPEEKKPLKKDPELPPFSFLGYCYNNNYYVMPRGKAIPVKIGPTDNQIKNMIYDIAPREWWGEYFIGIGDCIEWFRAESVKRGVFSPEMILGVGAHYDNEEIIVNCGNGIFIPAAEKKIKYEEYRGELKLKKSTIKLNISGNPWTTKEGKELFQEIQRYGFHRAIDYFLLLGWITLAPFASLLVRRPHLAITGPKGCGKTWLLDNVIKPALGPLAISAEGGTTEAGIRQEIGSDCRPVVFDEFEAHNPGEESRNKAILTLARSAYGGEGKILKGTTAGKPIIFSAKTMFCFVAINIILDNDADRSRIAMIKMRRKDDIPGKLFQFEGLKKRAFNNWSEIEKAINAAKKHIIEVNKLGSRQADTLGPLIGAAWSVISDQPFLGESEEFNQTVCECMKELNIDVFEDVPDEITILDEILNHRIKINVCDELTIAELITRGIKAGKPEFDQKLRQIGIRRDTGLIIDGTPYNMLAVSTNSATIKEALRNSPHREYKNILFRHPAAIFENTRPINMAGGKKTRCIILDWKKISELHFGEVEENQALNFQF
jgi:hypothetical protein